MVKGPQWTVSVERLAGEWHAVLREKDKADYPIPIAETQLAWFAALKNLLRDDAAAEGK